MNKKLIGYISVDAGVCWVGDPCYIIHPTGNTLPRSIGKDWDEFCDKLNKEINIFHHDGGHEGLGICVESGFGDGMYPVYIQRDKESGRIAKLIVEFIK